MMNGMNYGRLLGQLKKRSVIYLAGNWSTRRPPISHQKVTSIRPKVCLESASAKPGQCGSAVTSLQPGALPLSKGDEFRFELSEDHIEMDRREALAKWIASPENPLTWRSIVNRVWQHHFGQGLLRPQRLRQYGGIANSPGIARLVSGRVSR